MVTSQLITVLVKHTQIPYVGYFDRGFHAYHSDAPRNHNHTSNCQSCADVLHERWESRWQDESEILHPAVLPTDNDSNIRALQAANRWWDIWALQYF